MFLRAVRLEHRERFIVIDASHVRSRDFQRKKGRAVRGQPAQLFEYFTNVDDGQHRSLYAAFDIDGFVLDACHVLRGSVRPIGIVQQTRYGACRAGKRLLTHSPPVCEQPFHSAHSTGDAAGATKLPRASSLHGG